MIGLLRVEFPASQGGALAALVFVAVAIVAGLILGNVIYQALLSVTLEVNVADLSETLQRAPAAWPAKVAAGIGWLLAGYYELYGAGHFVAGLIAGGFAAWTAHKLLPAGQLDLRS